MLTFFRGRQVVGCLMEACGLLVLLLALSWAPARRAEAYSCRTSLLPNGTALDGLGCVNCHLSKFGGGPRNDFGKFIERVANGCLPFWNETVATEDSDHDGLSNGEELNDPQGLWRPGDANPGDPETVSNPGLNVNPPASFRRGDTDGSGVVDISDPIFNLTFQFVGGIDALPCEDAADVDDSGLIDISDPIFNLTFQFVGGIDPPSPPGPLSCGPDPTADDRGCENYPRDVCGDA